ncbi:MAG TPA: nuclear transport factor 2 family protein [Pyrinomonadaceae bacterium]|jgi:ketosteroid isomerase-like protein
MKRTVVTMLIMAAMLVFAFGQKQDETQQNVKFARHLKQFESDWLTAILNRDETWLERFSSGKMLAVPSENDAIKSRSRETLEMIDPKLKPDEMKVRITGNIMLLTNAGNRSFNFLDTFNRRGDKWQIIATHFSENPKEAVETAEQKIIKMEREWSVLTVKKDIARLRRIVADDFSGVESSGRIIDKTQFINDIESGSDDVQSESTEDLKVRVFGDTAVVTGRLLIKGRNKEADYDLKLLFTDVWTKRGGEWQVVNYQATKAK